MENEVWVQDAVNVNNDGANLFSVGRDEEAIDKFKAALCITRSLSKRQAECQASSSFSDSPSQSTSSLHSVHCSGVSTDQDFHVCPVTVKPKCVTSDDSFIYNHALVVRSTGNIEYDTNFVSACIIFNMALLYNISSIRRNSSSLQGRSLQLYEMSLGLLANLDSSNVDSMFLSIACLNNMSQITLDLGEYERAKLTLDHLRLQMSTYKRQDLFEDADIHGFMLNVMLMNTPSAARAA